MGTFALHKGCHQRDAESPEKQSSEGVAGPVLRQQNPRCCQPQSRRQPDRPASGIEQAHQHDDGSAGSCVSRREAVVVVIECQKIPVKTTTPEQFVGSTTPDQELDERGRQSCGTKAEESCQQSALDRHAKFSVSGEEPQK